MAVINGVFWLCFSVTIIAFIHEYGHYIATKIVKVKVEEFAIGMGKSVYSITSKSGVIWKICMLPIGGYLKILGQSDIPSDKKFEYKSESDRKMSFESKSPIERIFIAIAGPMANIFSAFIILFCIYFVFGKSKIEPIVTQIEKESNAQKMLKIHDRILAIDSQKINEFSDIRKAMMFKENCDKINLSIERNRKILNIELIPLRKKRNCLLGIYGDEKSIVKYNTISETLQNSSKDAYNITYFTAKGILQLLSGKRGLEDISGPLKIGKFSKDAANLGAYAFLYFIVIISIGVGLMNLLPIPVLDGGMIFINLMQIIIRRPISLKIQLWISRIGAAIVIGLMILGVFNDILFFIKK